MHMERSSKLLIVFSAVLLLFTGVASAETGIVLMTSESGSLFELLNIIDSFINDLKSLFQPSMG